MSRECRVRRANLTGRSWSQYLSYQDPSILNKKSGSGVIGCHLCSKAAGGLSARL